MKFYALAVQILEIIEIPALHENRHIPTYSSFYTGQNKTHSPYGFPTLITGVNLANILPYFQSDYGCKYIGCNWYFVW